jgi:short-subunit dehydrogenase
MNDIANVLITGGSKGVGLELTKFFVKKKFKVFVLSRSFKEKKIKKKINFIKCNILNKKDFIKAKKKIKKIFPRIIIHCIGGGLGAKSIFSSIKKWEEVFHFNMGASIEINNSILPDLVERKMLCSVIYISSSSTLDCGPDINKYGGAAPYVCAKAFLNMYVKIASREFKDSQVSFLGFLPGPILLKHKHWFKLKNKNRKIFNEFKKDYLKGKSFLTPKKVAKVITNIYQKNFHKKNGELIEIKN